MHRAITMSRTEREAGDALAAQLIAQYWDALTSQNEPAWNYRMSPLRYMPRDRWATRQQWIDVAKRCVDEEVKLLFGLETLLAEGCMEYVPFAEKIVAEWDKESGQDPEYYNVLAYLPRDNDVRQRWLCYGDGRDDLGVDQRSALLMVEDEALCRHLAASIERIFRTERIDHALIEERALPMMAELGRMCAKHVDADVIDVAKLFQLEYLDKDRVIAPSLRRRLRDGWDHKSRLVWARLNIAEWAWRIGWFDLLESLRRVAWYWDHLFAASVMDFDNNSLLVWSQYARDTLLRKQALHVMRDHAYYKLDGAISWVRMSHVRWPPE